MCSQDTVLTTWKSSQIWVVHFKEEPAYNATKEVTNNSKIIIIIVEYPRF